MPSYVSFHRNDDESRQVAVGHEAKAEAKANPLNTIFDMKRFIGRNFTDKECASDIEHMPYKVVPAAEDAVSFCVELGSTGETQHFSPEEVSSIVLSKLKHVAKRFVSEKQLCANIEGVDAVITVPAYFSGIQRETTKKAGQLAGLNVLSIIDEPTAAAIAYGMDLQAAKAQTTLVFDLGGGTFDVSLVTIRDGRYKVLATNGDTHLGGEDIDNKLIEHFNKALADQQVDNASLTPEDQMQVKQAAERVKIELSSASEATFKVALSSGAQHQVQLARDEFLKMNKPVFDRCMDVVERVLKDAKSIDAAFTKKSVDEVVLVGGSTRIPHVSKLLKDYFKREPSSGIDPDEAVAYGAAIQAAILSGDKSVQGMHVFGVTPMDLGILIHGATPEEYRMAVIIPHNTPIPVEMTMPFKTVVDNQIAIKVEVVQGDEKEVANVTSLGEFTLLDGLPPNQPAGETSIQITFALDGDGIFSVSAKDLESDHEKATIIEKYKSPTGEQPAAALERRKNLAKQISTWNRGVLPAEKPGP